MYLSGAVAITAQEGGLGKPDPKNGLTSLPPMSFIDFLLSIVHRLDEQCQVFQILKNDPTLVFGISQFV
jgi:hypothetical protein